MKVNIDGIKGDLLPIGKEAIENLESAYETLSSITVPSGYSFATGIENYKNNIQELKTCFQNLLMWILGKVYEVERIEDYTKEIVDEILNWSYQIYGEEYYKIITTDWLYQTLGDDCYKNMTTEEFFATLSSEYFDGYGLDQGILKRYYYFEEDGLLYTEYFVELVDIVMERYDMSAKDATLLLTCIDSGIGACSHAVVANNILAEFKDDPLEFEKTFGFPMTRITRKGEVVLNAEELLIDLYIYLNSEGAPETPKILDSLFDVTPDGLVVDDDMVEYVEVEKGGKVVIKPQFKDQQRYRYGYNDNYDYNGKLEGKYLESKGLDYEYEVKKGPDRKLLGAERDEYCEAFINDMVQAMDSGKQIDLTMLTISEKNPYTIKVNSVVYGEREYNVKGHGVNITEVNEDGIVFSTWGRKGYMTYDKLFEADNLCYIVISDIKKDSEE